MDAKIDLKTILELHYKWLQNEPGGSRANLSGADLSGADLIGANLSDASLSGANLSGANLIGADLSDADLSDANLSRAYLVGAYLSRANLIGACLSYANLNGADLNCATGAELALAMSTHLPEGQFDAWKKCANGTIVHLRIPAKAKRSHGCERKCRAEYVKVLEVYDKDGKPIESAVSIYSGADRITYKKGLTVYPDGWDENRWNTCGKGIHFFITRLEAEAYQC